MSGMQRCVYVLRTFAKLCSGRACQTSNCIIYAHTCPDFGKGAHRGLNARKFRLPSHVFSMIYW